MQNDIDVVTIEELARTLKISVSGIRHKFYADPHWIPHFKIGRVYRFNKLEVIEHLKNKTNSTLSHA